jgi:hypothetical protein
MVEVVAVIPERSLAQRLAALERANEIRTYRAQLKRDVTAGKRSVRDVLLFPEDEVETMKVVDLLVAVPKVGRVKANKWLSRTRVSPSKTIGGMSERQRRELLALVPVSLVRVLAAA